tara:strand:+ start:777 stop:1154 length:378 start_codon:yes stop_codon:yes gene_type:complete
MFDLTTLADNPTEKELHQLAMKTVGDNLIAQGYEFVAVNSELKKDPQFVCKKEKQLIFIVVKATVYPANPKDYDLELLDKIKSHAEKYDATVCFAGVGFARADNYNLPLVKSQPYAINYEGLQYL